MKANEAPEKIYISVIPSKFGGNKTITCGKDFPNAVEYTRTDAFIEKACEWLKNNVEKYYYLDEAYDQIISIKNLNNDFKKYMKQ